MKIKSAEFEQSAPDLRSCPHWRLPEFALIGRSNVGKSSLINSLTQRRNLARVSATPGKTQLLNFYVVNGAWSIVDLPGYGYAQVGKQRRLEFNTAVAEFIAGRRNLRAVYVLIDSRLEPQPIDLEFVQWLEAGPVPFAVVFTKIDKQSSSQTKVRVDQFKATVGAGRATSPAMLLSSAETGAGRSEILADISARLAADHPQHA